jgi:hypothetical protein
MRDVRFDAVQCGSGVFPRMPKDTTGRPCYRVLPCVLMAAMAAAAVGQDLAAALSDPEPRGEGRFETVFNCMPDEAGRLSGGPVRLWVDRTAEQEPRRIAPVETLTPTDGPVGNRIHVVFVGDGYTAGQLGTYAQHVSMLTSGFFGKEPFITYGPYFAVHRVDVVSTDSGVSHDPVYPTWRNTALQMQFWCNGMERLLCVNVGLAYNYAGNAPGVNLVAAIANASKYGGAGYATSNLATASGNNFWSPEVLLHEFGHALGNLADEYDYNDGANYTGPERPEANVSIRTASQMAALNAKWAAWLGVNQPQFDGLVSTFEGARYFQYGLFRPTNNSIMRGLNRPFNLPSVEATLIEMYKIVKPIDDAAPVGPTYPSTAQLWVQPIQPSGHSLDVQWLLDNQPIPGATGHTLDLATLGLTGTHIVDVVVVDNTPWVRNAGARQALMTERRRYNVVAQVCYADCEGNGLLNVDDFICFINEFAQAQSLPPAQQVDHYANCDGSTVEPVLTVDDFLCFINAFAAGCP